MDEINIKYDYADIEHKTDSEKIDLLLKIGFANHNCLNEHGKILFGNGKSGLCDLSRWHHRSLNTLWGIVLTAILGFASVLFTYITGHK